MKWTLLSVLVTATPMVAGAQSVLGDLVNGLAGKSGSALSSAVSSLIGNKTVSQASLVGTWNYTGPAIAFESSNLANQLGGALAAGSAEKKLSAALEKYGIKSGKVKLTFKDDGSYSCTINNRTVSGQYSVSGSTLTLTKAGVKTMQGNVKLTGSELQLTIEADKLLSLVSSLGNVTSGNATLSTLTSFMKGFDGVNLGMKFSK